MGICASKPKIIEDQQKMNLFPIPSGHSPVKNLHQKIPKFISQQEINFKVPKIPTQQNSIQDSDAIILSKQSSQVSLPCSEKRKVQFSNHVDIRMTSFMNTSSQCNQSSSAASSSDHDHDDENTINQQLQSLSLSKAQSVEPTRPRKYYYGAKKIQRQIKNFKLKKNTLRTIPQDLTDRQLMAEKRFVQQKLLDFEKRYGRPKKDYFRNNHKRDQYFTQVKQVYSHYRALKKEVNARRLTERMAILICA